MFRGGWKASGAENEVEDVDEVEEIEDRKTDPDWIDF